MSYERMKKREAELKAEVARMLRAAEAAMPRRTRLSARQARRRLPDWVATSRNGWRRSSSVAALRRTPGWPRGKTSHRGRKGTAAPSRRPQEAGQTGGAAIGPTDPKSQRNFTDPKAAS